MFAVFVDNHQLEQTTLVCNTIFDDEETARVLAETINKANPAHVMAWIKDWPKDEKGVFQNENVN